MPDVPAEAITAAEAAIRDAFPGEFGQPGMPEPDALARAALEAAAPLLAGAWGAFECEPLVIDSGHPTAADRAMVARATGGGIRSGEGRVRFEDEPDLTAELNAAEAIVMDHVPPEVQALRDMHWLIEARYEVIAGSRKADGADGFFAALEHLDLCEPEEFYGDRLPEAIGRAHAWAVAKGPLR